MGTSAMRAVTGGTAVIGASAIRACVDAPDGSEAAIGEMLGTTRRFVRVLAVPTTADSAAGVSGVTPLAIRFAAEAWIFSAAVFSTTTGFSTAGFSTASFSDRIRSTAFSVTGFSLIDFSSVLSINGETFGCSVTLGSTVAAGAEAVIDVGSVPACVAGSAALAVAAMVCAWGEIALEDSEFRLALRLADIAAGVAETRG